MATAESPSYGTLPRPRSGLGLNELLGLFLCDLSERTRTGGEIPASSLVVDGAARVEHGSDCRELRWSQKYLGGRVGPLQSEVEPILLVAGLETEAVALNFFPRHDPLPVDI